MSACPFCQAKLIAASARCAQCTEGLLWCGCRTANSYVARYCRRCGQRIVRPPEWRLPRGTAGAASFAPVRVPFPPAMKEAYRMGPLGRLTAQFVAGYGHLFFPIYGRGVAVVPAGKREPRLWLPTQSQALHALAITDEYLLMGGDAGLEAVQLPALLRGREAPLLRWLREPLMPARGFSIALCVDAEVAACATAQHLVGYSLADGRQLWCVARQGRGPSPLLVAVEGLVLAIEPGGQVQALWPATGALAWQHTLPERPAMRAGCTAWGNRLYLVGTSGSLLLLLVGQEQVRGLEYPQRLSEITGMATDGQTLFVSGAHGLLGFMPGQRELGPLMPKVFHAPPLVTQGTIFGAPEEGDLMLAPSAPHAARHHAQRGTTAAVMATPVLLGDHLYLAAESGEVVAYALGGGVQP